MSGHLGFHKTFNKIRSRYWWPKMNKDILEYILTCSECQARKTPATLSKGLLMPIATYELWDRISIDLLVPFAPTFNYLKRYLIATLDHFRKYIFTRAIRTKEADEVAFFLLEEIICKVGCPRILLSDSGKEFVNQVVQDYADQLEPPRRQHQVIIPPAMVLPKGQIEILLS